MENQISNKNIKIFLVLFILILRVFPYIIQNDIIAVQSDNLDSNVPTMMVLKHTNTLFDFSNATTIELIGGENNFKRNFLLSGNNVTTVLFYLFPPLIAYKINYILSILIGFFGIYFLSSLISRNINFYFKIFISISFTLMPWFHIYNCGYVAAVPFLLYAILNIYFLKNIKLSYIILLLFPFFSSLFLTSFFVLIYYGLFITILLLLNKNKEFKLLLLGFVILVVGSILSELSIFNLNFFDKEFVSHRTLKGIQNFNYSSFIENSIKILKHGRVHAVSNHNYLDLYILLSTVVLFFMHFFKGFKLKFLPFVVLSFLVFNTLLSEIANSIISIPFLKGFDFSRFTILNPSIIYVAFILFLDYILSFKRQVFYYFSFAFVILNLIHNFRCSDYQVNLKNSIHKIPYSELQKPIKGMVSFNDFYDTKLFDQCKVEMYKIERKPVCISLGLYPGILNFNNLSTLDHYTNNYSLEYKKEFRKIIVNEINKSDLIKNKFDYYGNRCYLFSSELMDKFVPARGDLITKFDPTIHVKNLDINVEQLKKMKCNFIVSTVIIDNSSFLDISLIKIIEHDHSIYKIYIYHID